MKATNHPKTYIFETVNKGDVTISISGEYIDGCVDIEAEISSTGDYREWSEIDAGGVDEIFEWLMDRGVEFESDRSLWFNFHYVADVMIDRFCSEQKLLDEAAAKSSEELERWRDFWLGL